MKKKLVLFLIMQGLTNIALIAGEVLNTDLSKTGMFMIILVVKLFIDIIPTWIMGRENERNN